MIPRKNSLRATVILLALGAGGATGLGEDRIEASGYSAEYLLYEPIVLEVRLILDEPFVIDPDNAEETLRQLKRLHRRLDAVLLRGGDAVQEFWLTSPDYEREDGVDGELCAQVLGFIGKSDKRGEAFAHFEEPGEYEIVVRDSERGVESEPVSVLLRAPARDEIPAAELFKDSFAGVITAVVKGKADADTRRRFERLAEHYPNTPYGKYATVLLAKVTFGRTLAVHRNEKGATVWQPVVDELRKAASVFAGRHPLRGELLFSLARAQVSRGDLRSARQTLEVLSGDFTDGNWAEKARKFVGELSRDEQP